MKFGPVPVEDAAGAILAHAASAGSERFRKGRVLSADDLAQLAAVGTSEIIVARLEDGDLVEDVAAGRLADAMRYAGIRAAPASTGRVNLHALQAGVFTVERATVDAFNAVDPAITLATLPEFATVERGQMVATVKIIPFAVPAAKVAQAIAALGDRQVFAVHGFTARRVGLVQTELPTVKASVLDKTARLLADRLDASGSYLGDERRCAHDAAEVADALSAFAHEHEMLVVFGASAVSDDEDVIPAAIRLAGGRVERTGMPVDPGNLLVLGELDGKPVIGAPGCARSPKLNGFDWVLDRLMAGLPLESSDIAGMGVGGLLMEIPSRPQPRESGDDGQRLFTVLLAAGRSSRMGGPNKLLALFDGVPLVRRMAQAALAAATGDLVVVTGHQPERITAALAGLPARIVHNPRFGEGLSTSLKAGIAALPRSAAGALVMLGDMPGLAPEDLARLATAFGDAGSAHVVRATHNGKRGNPVVLPRSLFAAVAKLEGDTGARHLIEAEGGEVVDIELGSTASLDVDTVEAMAAAGGTLQD